jgi:hypothetical protein
MDITLPPEYFSLCVMKRGCSAEDCFRMGSSDKIEILQGVIPLEVPHGHLEKILSHIALGKYDRASIPISKFSIKIIKDFIKNTI